jgi:hypothetical protein
MGFLFVFLSFIFLSAYVPASFRAACEDLGLLQCRVPNQDSWPGTLRLRLAPEFSRRFWRSYAPSNGSVTLLAGRFLPLQRRSGGASTLTSCLHTGLRVATHWRSKPLRIPCTSGVHVDRMATGSLGAGLTAIP